MSTSHRRSCDRCHLQKVRCLRNPQSDSCARCVKAGAPCNYSLKQKSGRPLTKPPPHSRSRSWGYSQEDDSAFAAGPYRSVAPPQPPLASIAVEMLEMEMDDNGIPATVSSGTGMATDMAFSESLAGWDLSFLSSEKSSSSTLCHPEESIASEITSSSAGSSESVATGGSGRHHRNGNNHRYEGDANHSAYRQTGNQLEVLSEQLTVLSARILRSTRLITCPGSPILTVTSPHVEGLFEATSTLITIVDNLGQCHATSTPSRLEGSSPESSSHPQLERVVQSEPCHPSRRAELGGWDEDDPDADSVGNSLSTRTARRRRPFNGAVRHGPAAAEPPSQ
ncbi:hypothetical protein EsH8_I_001618 [Colletotrichum jinshuiense]